MKVKVNIFIIWNGSLSEIWYVKINNVVSRYFKIHCMLSITNITTMINCLIKILLERTLSL